MTASHKLICGHCVTSEGSTNAPGRTPRPLTARERRLVELVFRKPLLTNAEIAERMGTTKATTASRLISLRRKGWAIPSRRGQTRPEPDWHAEAIPLIRSYRARGMSWTAIGRQLGRSGETIRKLFLRRVQDTSQ
jgi:DNA-binding CsgD family transcriptional regulator